MDIICCGKNNIVKFNYVYPLKDTNSPIVNVKFRTVDKFEQYLPLNKGKYYSTSGTAFAVAKVFPERFPNGAIVQVVRFNYDLSQWELVGTLS